MRYPPRMTRLISLLIAVVLASSLSPSIAQAPPPWSPPVFADPQRAQKLAAAFPEVDAAFQNYGKTLVGFAYGVIIDGQLAHVGSGGVRDLAGNGPIDQDTVFRIASMTKSFTALCILKLRDGGKLSLEDPVEKYIPELAALKYPTTDSPKITIRHLLGHAEGFPEDNPWGDQQLARTEQWLSAAMKAGIPFSNPPGLAYEYSNYGFGILGQVVVRVAKEPYRDYVTREILKPLGMSATVLEAKSVPANRLAHGYRREDNQWKEEPQLPDGVFGAMGGMLTSTRDLAKYVAFHLAAWPPRDDADTGPVKRSSVREMHQVSRMASASVVRTGATPADTNLNSGGYGYGLRIRQTCAIRHVVAHSGGLPGFGSLMQWYPELGVGFIAMGSTTYSGWGNAVEQATAALLKTGALQPRVATPSPALLDAREKINGLINDWDDATVESIAADNLFKDIAKDRRKAALDELKTKVGACRPGKRFDVENALRGQWTMTCEKGDVNVSITLAPTMPPKVQYWVMMPGVPGPVATCR